MDTEDSSTSPVTGLVEPTKGAIAENRQWRVREILLVIYFFPSLAVILFLAFNSLADIRTLYHRYMADDSLDDAATMAVREITIDARDLEQINLFKSSSFDNIGIHEGASGFKDLSIDQPQQLLASLADNKHVTFAGETIDLTRSGAGGRYAIVATEITFSSNARLLIGDADILFAARRFTFGGNAAIAAFDQSQRPAKAGWETPGAPGRRAGNVAFLFLDDTPTTRITIDLRGEPGGEGGNGSPGRTPVNPRPDSAEQATAGIMKLTDYRDKKLYDLGSNKELDVAAKIQVMNSLKDETSRLVAEAKKINQRTTAEDILILTCTDNKPDKIVGEDGFFVPGAQGEAGGKGGDGGFLFAQLLSNDATKSLVKDSIFDFTKNGAMGGLPGNPGADSEPSPGTYGRKQDDFGVCDAPQRGMGKQLLPNAGMAANPPSKGDGGQAPTQIIISGRSAY